MERMSTVFIAVMLVSTSFLVSPSAESMRATGAPLRVRTEWESPQFNGSANIIMNDTDRDGIIELIVWGEFQDDQGSTVDTVMVYKPPAYDLVWQANFSNQIYDLSLADLYLNGSVQLIIEQTDYEHTNFTVVSGNGYGTIWTGPDMDGNVFYNYIEDIDTDGELEFVWVNTSSIFDGMQMTYESHIQVFGARSHQSEWTSPAIPQDVMDFQALQLDSDPALELYMMSYDMDENFTTVNQTFRVFDGRSHSLQCTGMVPDGPSWFSQLDIGDIDNDTSGEVLLQTFWSNRSDILMFSAVNGSLLWNFSVGNTSNSAQVADIDADGAMEILATAIEDVDPDNSTYNLTHYVLDLRSRSIAWKAGPFLSDQSGTSFLYPIMGVSGTYPDIMPQTVPQFVLSNVTNGVVGATATHDIIDGKTLAKLWTSPEFSSIGYGGMDLLSSQADSDPAREIAISDAKMDLSMNFKAKVHIYSDNNFTEEWTSEEYAAYYVMAVGVDVIGSSAPELLLQVSGSDPDTQDTTSQTIILNGDTHNVLWTGPKDSYDTGNFADLYGSPQREIIHIAVNQTTMDRTSHSTLSVYNDTTYALAWTAGEQDGEMSIYYTGDLDNDTVGELVTSLQWEDQDYNTFTNITVREFTEEAPLLPDIAVTEQDISISNSTPVAGMPLNITVNVSNIGTLNATGCCVTLLLDEQLALEATVDAAIGNRTQIAYNWTAVAGNHTFKVLADPLGLIHELNETNNNASLEILVRERPRPVPVISSPLEGANITTGTNITFNGTASVFAPGGSRSFYWKYDGLTYLGNTSLFNATLPSGSHRVSLYADDGYFNASTSVNVTVGPYKPPPGITWAVISSPEDGAEFTSGEQIRFDGTQSQAARAEYALSYAWSSNRSGPLGVAANFTRALPAGVHNITLRVDDGHGCQSFAHVEVKVKPSTGVVAIISSPVDGQAFDASELIAFDGSRSTGPQGTVLSYVWTSSLAGGLGSEKTFSRKLLAGNHTISLRVSDGQGHSSTETVNISVTGIEDLPPTVNITYPAEGAILSGTVNITGTAWDETAVVSVKVKIDNDAWMTADGTTNWTFAWNTSSIYNGTHTITARADDGNHTSVEVSVNVTVDNRPSTPHRPPVKQGIPVALLAALAVVVILAVAVVAFLVIRSRRRTPPAYNLVDDSRGIAPPRM